MHANIACMAAGTSNMTMGIVDVGWCRGMLAGAVGGGSAAPRANADGTRGRTRAPGGGMSERDPDVGIVGDAGTSHSRGRRGGQEEEAGSGSDVG